jgi:hypothetical protein
VTPLHSPPFRLQFPFFTKKYSISYGAVFEEINNKDADFQFAAQGSKILPNGTYDDQGPPTCLGMTGSDKQLFLQGRIQYENVKMEREVKEGTRALLTVSGGLFLQCLFCLVLLCGQCCRVSKREVGSETKGCVNTEG